MSGLLEKEHATMESSDQSQSGPSSRPLSEAYTTQDNASHKSNDDKDDNDSHRDPKEEREKGIEEANEPPRDEEEGFHQHGGEHDEKQENNIVDFDGPNDPENPQNWPFWRKIWMTCIMAMLTFVISFGSSVFSATTTVYAERFGVSQEVMILGVTLYVCGFACGPLVWGPLSELYGRRNPLMAGMIGFIVFQIPVAVASNIQTIMVCRFFGGAFGSAPLAIVAGAYVDFWDMASRGIATMAYAGAVFAGPTIGPIVGEFTVKNPNLGPSWTLWFTMIMAAFFVVLALPTIPESLAPIILREKAARLRFETKNWALHSRLEEEPVKMGALLRKYGLKPMQMIVMEPILIAMTLYISLVYGILYLIFFAFPFSFEYDRGFEFGVSSLPFVAVFIGVLIACGYMCWETRVIFTPKLVKAKKPIPEERLPSMMLGSVVLVIGMFWFAWTSYPSINPWPQIISGAFIGAGIIGVFMPAVIYLVDVYLFDANSALAANALVRSFVAAAFPLFSTYMYQDLGTQWASCLLAFLCLALVPFPIVFYFYGKKIRSKSKFAFNFG
ncbi:MFS general substrate transporter [Hortaea werneckii]|nr:MFS general substrate transporter [Hortaea werneckii]